MSHTRRRSEDAAAHVEASKEEEIAEAGPGTAGFSNVQWLLPAESGSYQPIVLCVAGKRQPSIDSPALP
jgi:hypothetical protein